MSNATNPQRGMDVKFERSLNGSVSFEAVKGVRSYGVPSEDQEDIDITTLDSEGYKENMGGWKKSGEITIRSLYTRENYDAALQEVSYLATTYYRSTLKNGDKFVWKARCIVSPEFEIDGALFFDRKLKPSGKVVRAAGAL